uniref:AI-2E family transporter n=1 Tax=candidate division WWE3 bacterium TaxID=2053526 RepID=A0A831Z0B3_UNCKA
MDKHYEITPRTIILGLAVLALVWVLIQIKLVVVAIFIALILGLALDPLVVKLKEIRLPRPVGVFLVFFFFLAVLLGLLAYGFTPMVNQIGKFIVNLPQFLGPVLNSLGPIPFVNELQQQLVSQATLLSANILTIAGSVVSNILFLIMVLFLTFYFLLDWENLKIRLVEMLNSRAQVRVRRIVESMEKHLGGWLRGQLILMVVVGVLVYLGLFALGVEYALPLAVIAGLFEVIPTIGPILSAVPALLVGFGTSFGLGAWILVLYIVVQQLENSLIVPNVMGRAVGFSPLTTLLIVFAGAQVFGIGGAILSIPIAILLLILGKDLLDWNNSRR